MSFDFMPKDKLSHTGSDRVSLLFSFNKGYPLKPIIHIASGGEIARLMLCIKKYLFSINNFSTIIFDEIDGGVSAHIGRKMGRILQQMSQKGQVICITHSPQIASLGSTHYKLFKEELNNSITTSVIKLNNKARVDEIARMLSGDELNLEAIANAKKMLDICIKE